MPNSCSLPSEPYLKCSTGSACSTGASVRNRPARYDATPTTVTASTALTCPACRRGSLVMVIRAPISPLRRGGQAAAEVLVVPGHEVFEPGVPAGLGSEDLAGVVPERREVGVLGPLIGRDVIAVERVDGRHRRLDPRRRAQLPHLHADEDPLRALGQLRPHLSRRSGEEIGRKAVARAVALRAV